MIFPLAAPSATYGWVIWRLSGPALLAAAGSWSRMASAAPDRVNRLTNPFKAVGVLAILPCSRTSPACPSRNRDRDRIFVHVQAHVGDSVLHDPSPMHEARRQPSGANLDACIL